MSKCLTFSIIALLVLFAETLRAQFSGGSADGFATTGLVEMSIAGAPRGVRALYVGGPGDGHHVVGIRSSLSGQSLAVLYVGGRGDGFDVAIGSASISGQSLAVLYRGGLGDGHDIGSTNFTLSGVDMAQLYRGGLGDGFDSRSSNTTLGGVDLAQLYGGGLGDGFDTRSINLTLGGISLAQIYGGGLGDGFDVAEFFGLAPLPLSLLALNATLDGEQVTVAWITTNERNTDYFVVERSADAEDFFELGEVAATGQGRLGGQNTYTFLDERPLAGAGYYRLQMHDLDGTVVLSPIVVVLRDLDGASERNWDVSLYPNPNGGRSLFVLPTKGPYSVGNGLASTEQLRVAIFDATGRSMHSGLYPYDEGSAVEILLSTPLPSGSYLVQISANQEEVSKVLVVTPGSQ